MPRRDASVQARLEASTLATLARYYQEMGEYNALKSASALVRTALEDFVCALGAVEGVEQVSAFDAWEVLENLRIFPRVAPTQRTTNLRNATLASEPHTRAGALRSTRALAQEEEKENRNAPARDEIYDPPTAREVREFEQALKHPAVKEALSRTRALTREHVSESLGSDPDEGEMQSPADLHGVLPTPVQRQREAQEDEQ